jgi:VanZ family protein
MRPRYIVATVLYCIFLWVLSSDTDPPKIFPWLVQGFDKVIHAGLYAVLGAIVSLGMRRSGKPVSPWAQCFVPILFAGLYGLSDEIHQVYVPNRTFDLGDLFADVAGATLAQAGLCFAYWRGAPEHGGEVR